MEGSAAAIFSALVAATTTVEAIPLHDRFNRSSLWWCDTTAAAAAGRFVREELVEGVLVDEVEEDCCCPGRDDKGGGWELDCEEFILLSVDLQSDCQLSGSGDDTI